MYNPSAKKTENVHKGRYPLHAQVSQTKCYGIVRLRSHYLIATYVEGANVFGMRMCTVHEGTHSSTASKNKDTQGGGHHPLKCANNQTNNEETNNTANKRREVQKESVFQATQATSCSIASMQKWRQPLADKEVEEQTKLTAKYTFQGSWGRIFPIPERNRDRIDDDIHRCGHPTVEKPNQGNCEGGQMWVQFWAQPHPQRSREQWGQIETKGVYNPKVTMTEYVQEGRQFTHIPNHANQTIWKIGIHAVGENLPCVENPNQVHKGHQPPHVLMHAEANNWTKQTSNRGDSLWTYDGDNVYCMRMCTVHEDIYSSKAPYMTNTQGGGYHPPKCAINQTNSGDGQRGNSHFHPTVTDGSTRDQQEPSTPNTE